MPVASLTAPREQGASNRVRKPGSDPSRAEEPVKQTQRPEATGPVVGGDAWARLWVCASHSLMIGAGTPGRSCRPSRPQQSQRPLPGLVPLCSVPRRTSTFWNLLTLRDFRWPGACVSRQLRLGLGRGWFRLIVARAQPRGGPSFLQGPP